MPVLSVAVGIREVDVGYELRVQAAARDRIHVGRERRVAERVGQGSGALES